MKRVRRGELRRGAAGWSGLAAWGRRRGIGRELQEVMVFIYGTGSLLLACC
jgi:hypothetical protein